MLSFAGLQQVGRAAFASSVGAVLGGLALTVWGGPRRLRMRTVLLCTFALAASAAVVGLRPSLTVVAVGAFGMMLWLTVLNGVYATIVQVKVPQRFHGRVFALNTLVAWSTLPIGYGVIAPYATRLFDPLARHASALVGTGPGRAIGLEYVVFAVVLAGFAAAALLTPTLSRFDDEVADAVADDLVGLAALAARTASTEPVLAPRETGKVPAEQVSAR